MHISLGSYVAEFRRGEESELPKITDLSASKEEGRRRDIQDYDEVVRYNSGCYIRTMKAAIIKARREREEEERMFRGGGRYFDRGGRGIGDSRGERGGTGGFVYSGREKRMALEELKEKGHSAL